MNVLLDIKYIGVDFREQALCVLQCLLSKLVHRSPIFGNSTRSDDRHFTTSIAHLSFAETIWLKTTIMRSLSK
jgi:hypothetical protein